MNMTTLQKKQERKYSIFKAEEILNQSVFIHCIATACERQCIHCNVDSQKLGRTRS